jgi:hypothetical protein
MLKGPVPIAQKDAQASSATAEFGSEGDCEVRLSVPSKVAYSHVRSGATSGVLHRRVKRTVAVTQKNAYM